MAKAPGIVASAGGPARPTGPQLGAQAVGPQVGVWAPLDLDEIKDPVFTIKLKGKSYDYDPWRVSKKLEKLRVAGTEGSELSVGSQADAIREAFDFAKEGDAERGADARPTLSTQQCFAVMAGLIEFIRSTPELKKIVGPYAELMRFYGVSFADLCAMGPEARWALAACIDSIRARESLTLINDLSAAAADPKDEASKSYKLNLSEIAFERDEYVRAAYAEALTRGG